MGRERCGTSATPSSWKARSAGAPTSPSAAVRAANSSTGGRSGFGARMARPMPFDELRSVVEKLESDIASGPIVPTVTPHEIRGYLASRYDFTKPLALDEVGEDVERMLRTWQVHVTHPRYFGLFNPSVTLASIIADTLVAMDKPQPPARGTP